jgi:hypothetical protein
MACGEGIVFCGINDLVVVNIDATGFNGGRFFWKAIVVDVACTMGLYVHVS